MARLIVRIGVVGVLIGLLCAPPNGHADLVVPICTAIENQETPAIDQGKIVWVDDRFLPKAGSAIYFYDYYGAKQEVAICTTSGEVKNPAISGNRIVWEDYRNAGSVPDIYMYDLATKKETAICTAENEQQFPDIDGTRIVWQDMRNETSHFTRTNHDIYMYDLSTGQETAICTDPGVQWGPRISGNRIVWQDARNSATASDIYMYDLATGKETPICTDPAGQHSPRISGNLIVWQDDRNGSWDIYMYDLSSGKESPVCALEGSTQQYPDVGDEWIVWEDNRNGTWNIYMYDAVLQREVPVSPNSLAQRSPAVSKGMIVWSAWFKLHDAWGDYDIFAWLRTGSQPCYPSAIYPEQSEELVLLREFRDNVLARIPGGTALIRLHYLCSPLIVERMSQDAAFRRQVKKGLVGVQPLVELAVECSDQLAAYKLPRHHDDSAAIVQTPRLIRR